MAVCDGVHGAKTEKVRQFGLEANPHYGELKGTATARIRQIINDLLVKDYLVLTSGDYPVLKLGEKGREFLKTESPKPVVLKLPKQQEREESRSKKQKRKAGGETRYPQLFEILRQKRYQMAQKAHIPPYIIFSDKTLREMSTYLPVSQEEMLEINGVGNNKYQKYGKVFSDIIKEFMEENHIEKEQSVDL